MFHRGSAPDLDAVALREQLARDAERDLMRVVAPEIEADRTAEP